MYKTRVLKYNLKGAVSFTHRLLLTGQLQYLLEVGQLHVDSAKNMTAYFDTFFRENKEEYDVVIADISTTGVFLSAESFDIPIILSTPGTSVAVENMDIKQEAAFWEMVIFKFVFNGFGKYIEKSRLERKLPEVVSQWDIIIPFEYNSRFPAMIYTSPQFYPKPHETMDYIFIGGFRNDSENVEVLSEPLTDWINLDSLDVIYVSMGTLINLPDHQIKDFSDEVRKQNQYRVVWSLSVSMQETVNNMGLTSDSMLYFSNYLPQYTLLGHPKVKLFVTHGGLLSSVDVIKRKKPSVCIPHLGDQFYNCRKMKSLGMSETVSSFSFPAINETIMEIRRNYASYLSQAKAYAEDLSKYEDVNNLNAFVQEITARKCTTLVKEFKFQIYSKKFLIGWFFLKAAAAILGVAFLVLVFKVMKRIASAVNRKEKAKKS